MELMKLAMFKSTTMSVSDFRKLLDGRVNKSIHAFLEQCDEDVELEIRFTGWQIYGDIQVKHAKEATEAIQA